MQGENCSVHTNFFHFASLCFATFYHPEQLWLSLILWRSPLYHQNYSKPSMHGLHKTVLSVTKTAVDPWCPVNCEVVLYGLDFFFICLLCMHKFRSEDYGGEFTTSNTVTFKLKETAISAYQCRDEDVLSLQLWLRRWWVSKLHPYESLS